MKDDVCVVEVGPHYGTYWRDKFTGIVVCTRHYNQYNPSDLGPFDWEKIEE